MNAAIAIVAKVNKYKRSFRKLGATTPAKAIVPEAHGIRKSIIFSKLVRDGILKAVSKDRYYLDDVQDAAIRKKRQSLILVILCIVAATALLVFFVALW